MTRPSISPESAPGSAKRKTRAIRAVPTSALSKQALVHELQMHQVELEQQNEELRCARDDLAIARDRFIDLFDFAPVSYLTLDRAGGVIDANLTAATEFGVARQALLGSQFVRFIAPSDSDRWQRLKTAALRRAEVRRIELVLRRQDGRHFHAQLDCLRVARPGEKARLRVMFMDISERRLAETDRRIATSGNIARESDRRRVAHTLHEDLGQRLGALKMRLGTLALPSDATSNRAIAESMAAEIDQALAVVRRMSTDLHPLILDNLGLNAALDWLARDVATRLGLTVRLHLNENDAPLDESLAIAIYRLTETAIEHFALHVDAGISIELIWRSQDLVLQFQSEPGHSRKGVPSANVTDLTQAFKDQVHLLGGRLEICDLPEDVRRVSVFISVQGPGRSLMSAAGRGA